MKCSVCGTENPDKNQFCNSCGKPLPKPQAGPVLKKEKPKTTWIVIGAIIVLILIAVGFFLFSTPASSRAPVVGKWAAGDNWVQLNSDYSAKAYDAGSAMTVEGTWEELDPARYQVDWDTGGQDIMNYDAATQSLAPEGSSVRMTKTESLPASTGTSATQAPVQATCDPAAEELYFITESNAAVLNNPSNPRVITISSPVYVTRIMTYHYNSNKGAVPGTIALKDESGKVYGPWQALDDKGATGTASVHWSVKINQLVPAGKYTLIDSDPSTWSTNSEVGNAGVVWVYVSKKCTSVTVPVTTQPAAVVSPAKVSPDSRSLTSPDASGAKNVLLQAADALDAGDMTNYKKLLVRSAQTLNWESFPKEKAVILAGAYRNARMTGQPEGVGVISWEITLDGTTYPVITILEEGSWKIQ